MMQTSSAPEQRQRPRPIPRRIYVRQVETLSPSMRRLTFEGSDLASFAWSGPAAHIKLIFPDPVSGKIPEFSPDERPATMRTYTPRYFDQENFEVQVDFALHGQGIASQWAAQATVGQELVLLGPAPGYKIDLQAAWYVLAADSAATPALETLLEGLPSHIPVTAFVEITDAKEQRSLGRHLNADIHWVLRSDPKHSALLQALKNFEWPCGDGRIYVGCESGEIRVIRKQLLETHGFSPAQMTTRGYWRIGASNHPDRDYGEE